MLLTKKEWKSKFLYHDNYRNEREDTNNSKEYRSNSWRHSIKLVYLQRLSQCTGGAAEGMLWYRFQYMNRSRSRTFKIKCMHFQRLSQCTGRAAEGVYFTISLKSWIYSRSSSRTTNIKGVYLQMLIQWNGWAAGAIWRGLQYITKALNRF